MSVDREQHTANPTANLFLLEELEEESKTKELKEGDLEALRAVADWINVFVARPHKDLGRSGTVCPFVPAALERDTLWLAPERMTGRSTPEIIALVSEYQRLFLRAQPACGEDVIYKSIVVVFTDLSPERAAEFYDDLFQRTSIRSYMEDGFVMGGFYEGNEGTAIYNSDFRPFRSPRPFLLIRQTVVSDWKFFLDNAEWFKLWLQRYGRSGAQALAEELRALPWRAHGD